MVKLIITIQNQRHGVELKDGVYRIGREKPADIVIPDSTISANHAELQVTGDVCRLRDLGSRNGTFINGQPVKAATNIKPTDDVRVGGVQIAIEPPQAAVKPLPAAPAPAAAPGPTAQMPAVQATKTGKFSWSTKNWLAGTQVIGILLVLFVLIQFYSESVNSKVRLANRYKALAAQFVNVLSVPDVKTVPPPFVDESLRAPLYVADRTGQILYPPPPTPPPPSPLLDPKTGQLWQDAKWGLFDIPPTKTETGLRSYPVRSGGDIIGFVVAKPGTEEESQLTELLLMFFVASAIAVIILFFRLKPIQQIVAGQLETMRLKITPLFNGFVNELPRSSDVPELNTLAQEIEKAYTASRGPARQGPRAQGHGAEFAPQIADLLDSAHLPYCFLDNDFNIVAMSSTMPTIEELSAAAVGKSIFESGMSNIQSKQLVHCLTEAKKNGTASVLIPLQRNGTEMMHEVSARSFGEGSARSQITGLLFTPTTAEN